jgi:hypothetical protein
LSGHVRIMSGVRPSFVMTTVVTSPAPSGARPSGGERRPPGLGPRSHRRRAVVGGIAIALLAVGCLLVTSDVRGRAEIRTAHVSLVSTGRQLGHLRSELAAIRRRLTAARSGRQAVIRSFDAAQSALSATQANLSTAEEGIHNQGLDLGALNTCVSDVEQALNQFAVGQTSGGVASLRASSTACPALGGAG